MPEIESNRPLQSADWAQYQDGQFHISGEELPIKMVNSDGTGQPLLKRDGLGADIIRFGAGDGVAEHTHIGQHVLFVLRGAGIVNYDGIDNALYPGKCYLVESWVPHAIYADKKDSLVLLVVGDDHRSLNDPERMELTESGRIERQQDDPSTTDTHKNDVQELGISASKTPTVRGLINVFGPRDRNYYI